MLGRRSELGKQLLDATSAALLARFGLSFNHNYAYTCFPDCTNPKGDKHPRDCKRADVDGKATATTP